MLVRTMQAVNSEVVCLLRPCRYECLFLSLVYVAYVVTLITTDKCLSPPVSDEEREFIEAATAAAVVGSRASMVVFRYAPSSLAAA